MPSEWIKALKKWQPQADRWSIPRAGTEANRAVHALMEHHQPRGTGGKAVHNVAESSVHNVAESAVYNVAEATKKIKKNISAEVFARLAGKIGYLFYRSLSTMDEWNSSIKAKTIVLNNGKDFINIKIKPSTWKNRTDEDYTKTYHQLFGLEYVDYHWREDEDGGCKLNVTPEGIYITIRKYKDEPDANLEFFLVDFGVRDIGGRFDDFNYGGKPGKKIKNILNGKDHEFYFTS